MIVELAVFSFLPGHLRVIIWAKSHSLIVSGITICAFINELDISRCRAGPQSRCKAPEHKAATCEWTAKPPNQTFKIWPEKKTKKKPREFYSKIGRDVNGAGVSQLMSDFWRRNQRRSSYAAHFRLWFRTLLPNVGRLSSKYRHADRNRTSLSRFTRVTKRQIWNSGQGDSKGVIQSKARQYVDRIEKTPIIKTLAQLLLQNKLHQHY